MDRWAVTVLLMGLLTVVWVARKPSRVSSLHGSLLGFGAAVALTALTSVEPELSVVAVTAWLLVIVVYTLLTELDREVLEQAALALAVMLASVAVLETAARTGLTLARGEQLDHLALRSGALVMHANVLAVVLLGAFVLGIRRVAHAPQGAKRGWLLAELALLYAGIAATFSRGGWLGWLVTVGVILVLEPTVRRAVLRPVRAAALAAAAALSSPFLIRVVFVWINRTLVTAPSRAAVSDSGRLVVWREALRIFAEHPLTGVGPFNFGPVYMARVESDFYWHHAHNVVINTAAEMGLVGLMALAGLAAAAGLAVWRAWHDSARRRNAAYAAALMAGLLIESQLDYAFRSPGVILLLLVMWNRLLPDTRPASRAMVALTLLVVLTLGAVVVALGRAGP